MATRKTGYPKVTLSDEEWALCAPYLTLMRGRRAGNVSDSLRRTLQRAALVCTRRVVSVADDAQRFCRVDGGATADATLAARGLL